jgi:hypothetical protein
MKEVSQSFRPGVLSLSERGVLLQELEEEFTVAAGWL